LIDLEKRQSDYLAANLATVKDMIGRLSDEDVVMRIGLEDHRDELALELAALDVRASADNAETR
jgi:hypothetical protein